MSPPPATAPFRVDPAASRRRGRRAAWSALAPGALFAGAASAASANGAHHGPLVSVNGWIALGIFALAYVFVAFEERVGLRKSKPVMVSAALIWGMIAWAVRADPVQSLVISNAFERMFLEFAELFFFLFVAMAYVGAMTERGVFEGMRAWLARRGFGYRALFWITGALAFALSAVLDNLTAALVVGGIVIAVGAGERRFIAMGCVNVVVAANAGGAWSAFGDVTTLMVWQARHVAFFDFFRLFLPALVNWLVPAALMAFAVPRGKPVADAAPVVVRFGGWSICALLALTITVTVIARQVLHLPPVFGMLAGLALLQLLGFVIRRREPAPARVDIGGPSGPAASGYDVFHILARAEWDTLLFFYGVLMSVGGLAALGLLATGSSLLYGQFGPTAANTILGMLSAIVDNVPIMYAVLQMHPAMNEAQWLLVTLTCGVGGSLLSIGSAAGVALMGAARGHYTFGSHLRWTWAIALGFVASVLVHFALNFPHGVAAVAP